MIILGIETSCDETAVAVVDGNGSIIAHIVFSQIDQHNAFGGVIPEFAARSHLQIIDTLINQLQVKYKIDMANIDAFAATGGPGLMGGLLVGLLVAKTLSFVYNKPFLAINHLQAHALLPTMGNNIDYPYLLLLVSGGHTQFVACLGVNEYKVLGETIDDAIGEAFDKSARMMGLGYPGGAKIEEYAKNGNPSAFVFPKPLEHNKKCDFSFSGLKTAVKNTIDSLPSLNEQIISDICASLQYTIVNIVLNRSKNAIDIFESQYGKCNHFVLSGGVSANLAIRTALLNMLNKRNIDLLCPPLDLCTDNGVMVAWCGVQRYKLGMFNELDFQAKSRWSLENLMD